MIKEDEEALDRKMFAAFAMMGILAAGSPGYAGTGKRAAKEAISHADALIAALDRPMAMDIVTATEALMVSLGIDLKDATQAATISVALGAAYRRGVSAAEAEAKR